MQKLKNIKFRRKTRLSENDVTHPSTEKDEQV